MVVSRASFCSAESQRASRGRESSQNQAPMPMTTEKSPSTKSMLCQPLRPSSEVCMSAPESGPERIEAMAEPLRNKAMALPRSAEGSQRVK